MRPCTHNPDPATRRSPITGLKETRGGSDRPGDRRAELGRRGESLACELLDRAWLTVLARNWCCCEGEIDIVAHTGGVRVICEVKTRSGDRLGTPAAVVTLAKQQWPRQLAVVFLAEHAARPFTIRFDVVAITWHPAC